MLHLRASRLAGYHKSPEKLIEELSEIRKVTVARAIKGKRGTRVTHQLEDSSPEQTALANALGVAL